MKILVTGFDPFGGETVNPAYEAVKLLPDTIGGAQIFKLEIPTVFSLSGPAVEEGIKKYQPDVVLCVGQAGGRASISVEKVAINLVDARIPDNNREQPLDEPLQADGPAAYFSTLPVKFIVQHVKDAGLPCYLSFTAGTYVCNSIMYNVLYMCEKRYPGIRAGFIHVPYACGQVIDKANTTPSMPLETIAKSLEYAIEAIAIDRQDSGESAGELH